MCIQELHEAELAFKDVCDQVAKAERFFPVPGASAGNGISAPPRGHSRPLIPKVQPCCHLISGLWHFWPCTSVLVIEGVAICTVGIKPGRKGLSKGIMTRKSAWKQGNNIVLIDQDNAGQAGARQLEVSLKGIGQSMAELQKVWVKIAPSSSWSVPSLPADSRLFSTRHCIICGHVHNILRLPQPGREPDSLFGEWAWPSSLSGPRLVLLLLYGVYHAAALTAYLSVPMRGQASKPPSS